MLPQYFIYFIIPISVCITYSTITQISNKQIKPNLASYSIWILATAVAVVAGLLKGSTYLEQFSGMLVILTMSIVVIFAIWHKQYYIDTTNSDNICFGLGLVGVIALIFIEEKNIAIILSIIVDGIACLPTLFKIWWSESESDNLTAFGLSLLIIGINILTIGTLSFGNSGFLIYTFFTNLIIAASIICKNRRLTVI